MRTPAEVTAQRRYRASRRGKDTRYAVRVRKSAEETSRSWSEWLWKCDFRSTVDRWPTPAEIARDCPYARPYGE